MNLRSHPRFPLACQSILLPYVYPNQAKDHDQKFQHVILTRRWAYINWIERFVLLIFLINFIQVPHSGDLNFSFSNFESYLIWFDDIWRKLNRNRLLHLIHQLLLQLRKDSFYFFFCIKMRSFFCVKSVHGSFFYYNTCLIILKNIFS